MTRRVISEDAYLMALITVVLTIITMAIGFAIGYYAGIQGVFS